MGAMVVAIQGERGAFSHQAALSALGPGIEVLPRATFDELFDSQLDAQRFFEDHRRPFARGVVGLSFATPTSADAEGE